MIYRLQESGRNGNPGNAISTMSASTTTFQLLWSAVGVIAFVAVLAWSSASRARSSATPTRSAPIGLVLLALPAVLPNRISEVPGTARRSRSPSAGSASSRSEFAKLALAVFFAGYLVAKRDVLALAGRRCSGIALPRARDLGPVLIAWGASLLVLVFESDIGTSALFFGLFLIMLYVATQRTSWLLIGVLLFLVGAWAASKLFSHVGERFAIWLHPFKYANVFCGSAQRACRRACRPTSSPRACTGWASAASWAPGWGTGSRT